MISKPVIAWYLPLVYSLICALADALDMLVLVVCPETTPTISVQPSQVDGMGDEELLKLFEDGERIGPTAYQFQNAPRILMKISQDIQQDPYDAAEANALNLLFAKTNIPVPRIRRILSHELGNIMVMDFIKGETLDNVWQSFSLWKKIRIAFILRRYIRQLRQLEAPAGAPPGPLSPDSVQPRECDCPSIFGQLVPSRGPFATYGEFSAFWNYRSSTLLKRQGLSENDPRRKEHFDDSSPLVLSHLDLNPRNMILGDDGHLWIIDWAWAGYYPVWFEYLAMLDRVDNEELGGFKDRFWELMIPFICGLFFRQEKWFYEMQGALYYR